MNTRQGIGKFVKLRAGKFSSEIISEFTAVIHMFLSLNAPRAEAFPFLVRDVRRAGCLYLEFVGTESQVSKYFPVIFRVDTVLSEDSSC